MKKGKSSGKSVSKTRKVRAARRTSRSTPIVRYRPYPKKRFNVGKGKPPKRILDLRKKAFKYKKVGEKQRAKAQRIVNKRLAENMRADGYTEEAIKAAKKYSLTGRVKFAETKRYRWTDRTFKTVRYKTKKGWRKRRVVKSFKVNGKWISAQRFNAKVRISRYNAVIKHYRIMYGLNLKEAQELYRGLRDEKFGQKVFEALY